MRLVFSSVWSHHKQDIHPSPHLALLSTATLVILISAFTSPLSQIYPSVSLCHVLMLILDLDRCPPETLLCIITHLTQIYAFFSEFQYVCNVQVASVLYGDRDTWVALLEPQPSLLW